MIHCAGITQTSLLPSTPPAAIRDILHVNLESAALLARALLRRHLKSPPASPAWHFLAVSSLLAIKSGVGSSVYAASKAGLIALTRAVALEGAEVVRRRPGAPGFRANVVVPGYIDTPMTKGAFLSPPMPCFPVCFCWLGFQPAFGKMSCGGTKS